MLSCNFVFVRVAIGRNTSHTKVPTLPTQKKVIYVKVSFRNV